MILEKVNDYISNIHGGWRDKWSLEIRVTVRIILKLAISVIQ